MSNETAKNIVILGAGKAGRLLAADIRKNHPKVRLLGFLDDQQRKNIEIIGTILDLSKLIEVFNIQEAIIAIPSISGTLMRRILLNNSNNRIPIKIVPRNQRIIQKNQVSYNDVKLIDFEDFLGRPFRITDINKLSKFYRNKIVLVTGGAGSIGSEIVRQLLDLEAEKIIIFDNSEYATFSFHQELQENNIPVGKYKFIIGDIRNAERVNKVMREHKPDIVFHAAAYKHVYLMEENPCEAFQNNVEGTISVANSAIKNEVKYFTFISTDKVVNPTSVMGATKKICEQYLNAVKTKKTKINTVRFGNVINSNGSVLPIFERQISTTKTLTVTDDKMRRFFMSIREAANLVIESTTNDTSHTTYILKMGELISIYEVALCLIRSKNLIPDVDIKIKLIGRKKGEKEQEELFTVQEKMGLRTNKNTRIWELTETKKDWKKSTELLARIKEFSALSDEKNVLASIGDLFPTLKHVQ